MSGTRRWGLVWAGAVAVVLGLVLLVTPTGVHHSGDCGSVAAPRHPTLHNDDTLEEQVQANDDCPGERTFRAGVATVAIAGGVAVVVLSTVRRRDESLHPS